MLGGMKKTRTTKTKQQKRKLLERREERIEKFKRAIEQLRKRRAKEHQIKSYILQLLNLKYGKNLKN